MGIAGVLELRNVPLGIMIRTPELKLQGTCPQDVVQVAAGHRVHRQEPGRSASDSGKADG
jgi:hypothetical protein